MDTTPWNRIASWNRRSTRFVHPPTFEWGWQEEIDHYRVRIADGDSVIVDQVITTPRWNLADAWDRLPFAKLELFIQAFNRAGEEVAPILPPHPWKGFRKCRGYDGQRQEPLDWQRAVHRNIAYLLEPAHDEVQPYEKGWPRSCWSAIESSFSRRRRHLAFPALHHPSHIVAFLNYASQFPASQHAPEALAQARAYGEWLLTHRQPARYACSLFPFSTIENGEFEGHREGSAITLFRAGRVGRAMLALYETFEEDRYLDYALHLGRVFARMQCEDGSWPYRVDPVTGETVQQYTSNAITPALFLAELDAASDTREFAATVSRAVEWVLANPVVTCRWEGQYEDIPNKQPFTGLQNFDVNQTIRYLAFYTTWNAEDEAVARKLNTFIEDQFVLWENEPEFVKCPTPTVLEQYGCYHPMEVHTGNWIFSLLALHWRTGDSAFLDRAVAAGNSIVKGQYENGAFSTWGYDRRFGQPLITWDWPGCNAIASSALLLLRQYLRALDGDGEAPLPKWRI